ncbi:hypothetical protein NIB75_19460 [Bacteroides uniformis]|nr:hypothetical protein [Bacteroides uniformis]
MENSDEYAYRLLKTKIQTSYRRPVDFYFRFLARFGPYGTYGNVYYPSITDSICRRYLHRNRKMNSGKAMDNGSPPFLLYNFLISIIMATALATTAAPCSSISRTTTSR